MVVTRKLLISMLVVTVGLFVVANPLGDAHHGLGRHNAAAADIGQALFLASLVAGLALVVLAVMALVQLGLRSRRVAS